MGMRTGIFGNQSGVPSPNTSIRSAGSANAGYASGGTSSFPVTGFPASAYLGNNRRVGGGYQASPSAVSSALSNVAQLDTVHVVIVLLVLGVGGYTLWHMENKR